MTGAMCTAFCNNKGYVYGATEYAQECYCGNKLSASVSLQNDTSCDMGCKGNSSEACGGIGEWLHIALDPYADSLGL